MATFVLVHGAFVGGWCWRRVAPDLRADGHSVHTPTLTGLGERIHLAGPHIGLETHINDIVNLLRYEDLRDVALVGWSYGGMIAAGVADRVPERLSHLIYLDADVPRDGDTSAPARTHRLRQELADARGDGWRVMPEDTRAWPLLLDGVPEERRDWIAERFAPHPVRTWMEPIHLTGAGSAVPTTYMRCTVGYDPDDEDTRRQDDRIRSEPDWRYVELSEGHAAPFSAPAALARALMEVIAYNGEGHLPAES